MMVEITGESIKSAIAEKLRSGFASASNGHPHSDIKFYKELIIQDMEKPCFFIWQMDVSQEKLMGNNYQRMYQMNIRFHPKDKDLNKYETLADIGNRTLELLNQIDVPIFLGRYDEAGNQIADTKPVRGTQMSFKIVEDVLQVFVTYMIRMKSVEESIPDMQTVEIN